MATQRMPAPTHSELPELTLLRSIDSPYHRNSYAIIALPLQTSCPWMSLSSPIARTTCRVRSQHNSTKHPSVDPTTGTLCRYIISGILQGFRICSNRNATQLQSAHANMTSAHLNPDPVDSYLAEEIAGRLVSVPRQMEPYPGLIGTTEYERQ